MQKINEEFSEEEMRKVAMLRQHLTTVKIKVGIAS